MLHSNTNSLDSIGIPAINCSKEESEVSIRKLKCRFCSLEIPYGLEVGATSGFNNDELLVNDKPTKRFQSRETAWHQLRKHVESAHPKEYRRIQKDLREHMSSKYGIK